MRFNSNRGEGLVNVLVGAGISAALAGVVATFMIQQNTRQAEQSNHAQMNQISNLIGGFLANESICLQSLQGSTNAGNPINLQTATGQAIPNMQPGSTFGFGRSQVTLDSLNVADVTSLATANRRRITISAALSAEEFSAEGVVIHQNNEQNQYLYTVYATFDSGGNLDSCLSNFHANDQSPDVQNHVCRLLMDIPAEGVGSALVFRSPAAVDGTNCFAHLQNDFTNTTYNRGSFPLISDQLLDATTPTASANPICDHEGQVVSDGCQIRAHTTRCNQGIMRGVNPSTNQVICQNSIVIRN